VPAFLARAGAFISLRLNDSDGRANLFDGRQRSSPLSKPAF